MTHATEFEVYPIGSSWNFTRSIRKRFLWVLAPHPMEQKPKMIIIICIINREFTCLIHSTRNRFGESLEASCRAEFKTIYRIEANSRMHEFLFSELRTPFNDHFGDFSQNKI